MNQPIFNFCQIGVWALLACGMVSCGPAPLPPVDPAPMSNPASFRFVDEDSKGVGSTFIGRYVDGNRVAYVLDYSGSMSGEGKTKLMQELAASIAKIPKESARMVTVITFDSSAAVLDVPAAEPAPATGPGWYNTSNASNTAIVTAARDKDTGGGTEWGPALRQAMQMSPKPDVVYFVTDGAPGDADLPKVIDEVLSLNRADGFPATIVPICTDESISPEVDAQLKRIDTLLQAKGPSPGPIGPTSTQTPPNP